MTTKNSKGFGAAEPEIEELSPPVVEEEVRKVRRRQPKKVEEPESKLDPLTPPAPPAPAAPVEKKKLHRIIKRR